MSSGSRRGTGSSRGSRRRSSGDGQQPHRASRSGTMVRGLSIDATSLKRAMSMYEDSNPTALPVLLDVVRGPERLPAEEELQETLRGKLRVLQADSGEVTALFTELSAHLLSISPEDKIIFVTFKTFEEIWKFSTYYNIGFLSHCLENVLFDPKLWLRSVKEDVSVEISLLVDTLNLIYKGILMQEGSFFASCSANQMFDSSISGGDLYLEQGDIAQFEPPFLGSGWTVRCLADGARGTAPKPSLEPVPAFHQWFLKSCPESILVGDGKPSCHFPLQFARGSCLATEEYDADGPDELSLTSNERIIIVGLLVSCFDWFIGRKESTGEVGLVKTNMVKPEDTYSSEEVFLDGEDRMFFSLQDDKIIEEALDLLKTKRSPGHSYKLDKMSSQDQGKTRSVDQTEDHEHDGLKLHIQRVLAPDPMLSQRSEETPKPLNGSISPSETLNSSKPRFFVPHIVEGKNHTEDLMPLFTFLENQDYNRDYGLLYRLTPDELSSTTFSGHSDEDQLTSFLSVARETARKKRLFWSQTRLCFLLGKLCVGRSKFSQARVYFEEALSVPREEFTDFRLLASIYYNLASIYILQKNTDRFFQMAERLVALLMGFPYCLEVVEDDSILKHILKKAILSNSKQAEARASFLLAKHYWARNEKQEVIPYIERLLVVSCEDTPTCSISPSCAYLTLGGLYNEHGLANLTTSSFRRASLEPSTTLSNSLSCILEVLNKLGPRQEASIPCHVAPYLHQALSLAELQEKQNGRHHALSLDLTVCLSEMFSKHQMLEQAIEYMHEFVETSPSSHSLPGSQVNSALIWLAWLLIDNGSPSEALDILELVLAAMPEHCTSPQEGEVLNLCGVALCSMGDLRRAVENYQAAIDICQEYEDLPNWAVAQANLGLLCLKAGATHLAQSHMTEAVQIFSELDVGGHEGNFITVLLELGTLHVKQGQMHCGKGCYEWALLLAISANLLDCELRATSQLCGLYSTESPDQAQCILYSLHHLQLLQRTGDRTKMANALEGLGHLYLSLGTHKAFQAALDYTKSSLGMFIDLGLRAKEAYGWLQAGKIYHLLGQTELVDLYIQAAQEVALSTGDTKSILSLLEAAGDIFFNSGQDREKAVTFYRDRALPIAIKTNSARSRLRLCNKLTELMLNLKMYGDAVEYAQTALDVSIALGDGLNERVAYHRLACLYHCLQQFELAEHFYLKTLALCPSPLQFDEETLYYVRVYQTLGDIIFYDVKDPFDAAGYYHLALAAAMDLGNKKSQLHLCTRLATIYHNFLMDRERSLLFYQRARQLASELNIRRINIAPEQQHSTTSQYKALEKSWKRDGSQKVA